MAQRRYELTDFEWSIIEPLLPNKPRGVPRVDDRRVLNGIYWRLRTGSPWADIPDRYGPYTTCYNRFVRWARLLDADMQRRAQIGLNKGEAHHVLKSALRIGRQGEIRDRTAQGQHFRMAGLNLLAAIIIYWNTKHLGQAVTARQRDRLDCSPDLLAHISPLGWAHILLTGEYRWSKK